MTSFRGIATIFAETKQTSSTKKKIHSLFPSFTHVMLFDIVFVEEVLSRIFFRSMEKELAPDSATSVHMNVGNSYAALNYSTQLRLDSRIDSI